jgi:transposase
MAVEGAIGLGRGIAQLLVAAGEPVVYVPAKLTARARLISTSSARKTDLAPGGAARELSAIRAAALLRRVQRR